MDGQHKLAYEAPTVTFYGTVQELTMGNGLVTPLDAQNCGALSGHLSSNSPSGVTCKLSS
jgi:hypothetical protein